MKFTCDRCKTRYSISEDRVRGKILKIRCKNCSAVITVREGMTVSAPKVPDAKKTPPPAKASPPPAPPPPPKPLVVEWYVSIDGEQQGPFDLEGAKTWVSEKPPSAELYCWSEGFDDWLPVEKVSHFRGLRRSSGLLGLDAVADPLEKTPAPLFAETMKQMTAEAPTLLEDENPFSAAYERKKRETASQASPAPRPPSQPSSSPSSRAPSINEPATPIGLPGPGGGSGPVISGLTLPEASSPAVMPAAQRSPLVVPLIAAGVVLLIVLGVLLYMALTGGDKQSGAVEPRSGSLGPDDVVAVYRARQRSVDHCYARAMRRDPHLEVPKTLVTLDVAGTGEVSQVSIPSLEGEPLGSCLVASIGSWRFPPSDGGFAGRFPIVFRAR